MLPVVTMLGMDIGVSRSTAVVFIETVFHAARARQAARDRAWRRRDFPVMLGIAIVVSLSRS